MFLIEGCVQRAGALQLVSEDPEEHIEHLHDEPEHLPEDLYGLGMASLIRDSRWIQAGDSPHVRFFRVAMTVTVLLLTVCLQVFLLIEFKRLVTAHAVHQEREIYNLYEQRMYDGHTSVTVNGFHRGLGPDYFNPRNFETFSYSQKHNICQIPLSQPAFLGCILAIWSFTVVSDMRKTMFLSLLILRTPNVGSLKGMLKHRDGDLVLEGLPAPLKAVLLSVLSLPRLVIAGVLLWLGCRWLTATHNFPNLLMNAIALEFILLLKDLIYEAVVPWRNKIEVRTIVIPPREASMDSVSSFIGSFAFILVVLGWVAGYMFYLQQVLPEYRWDIRKTCESFLANEGSGG